MLAVRVFCPLEDEFTNGPSSREPATPQIKPPLGYGAACPEEEREQPAVGPDGPDVHTNMTRPTSTGRREHSKNGARSSSP